MILSCIKFSNTYSVIPPGIWRAQLELSADSADLAEEESGGILPFNFEVRYITEDSFHVIIQNADERIVCTQISYGTDRRRGRDTIRIGLPAFGSFIRADYEEDAIEGFWYDPSRGDQYRIPFRAYHGQDYRFEVDPQASYMDFHGRWKATFSVESPSPYPAVLVMDQNAHHVTGTVLTQTGDYRYLEGSVENDRIFLSTFDGSHAYIFEAKMLPDGTLSGVYRSGVHYKTYWTAERSDTIALVDPYVLTTLAEGSAPFSFRFPNTNGDTISLDDPQYQGKPKIVTIFGTWCPNCMDENAFLLGYVNANPEIPIEIISIAFERHKSPDRAMEAIRNYKNEFKIPWEMLYGGPSNKQYVTQVLPMLGNFVSFPTMIFLDHDNQVVKIHTGFYGPATERYEEFKKEFDRIVRSLISPILTG